MSRNWIIALIVLAVVCLVFVACLGLTALAGWFFQGERIIQFSGDPPATTGTPVVIRPDDLTPNPFPTQKEAETLPPFQTGTAVPTVSGAPEASGTPFPDPPFSLTPSMTPGPDVSGPEGNLARLQAVEIPEADLYDLALRLEGKQINKATLVPPAEPLQVGQRQQFWISNTDNNQNFQVSAALRYITDHAYFWIQDGLAYDRRDLEDMARTFEERIYPTNREFFGSEWTPGIDGDPHIYILYARGLGRGVAGYFSSVDSYNPQVQEYSNGHEMFVFSADQTSFGDDYSKAVLAHEFQHMIHWDRDQNEEIWLNEGFSDLAMFLNGYSIGGHDWVFAGNPDLQLNDWPSDESDDAPHYGAAFLFTNYFLDRFGEEATQAVVANASNGLDSIDEVMRQLGLTDPLTGSPIGADDVFADWVLTNYLHDPSAGDGRYYYEEYDDAPKVSETERLFDCPQEMITRDVRQYGADYIRIRCDGLQSLHFEGSVQVGVAPVDPHSGEYAFWSNKGSSSDVTLTREFDFTDIDGPITLSYWTWFDLEKDFDYLYLEASTDGRTWQILKTPSGTDEDPTGANYGWGYNGKSGGGREATWIEEQVDLSQFSGQKVQIRFEYITDLAVNGEGFLLDDISIPEAGYTTDFETDEGGWTAAGWARIQNELPQTFRLALITKGVGTDVQMIDLPADNAIDIPLDFSGDMREAVLVVMGTTRYTRQPAAYRFNFNR